MAEPVVTSGKKATARKAAEYGKLLKPAEIGRRAGIALSIFRDHQFERTSPIPSVPPELHERMGGSEVVLPPARYVGGEGNQTLEGIVFLASLARALHIETAFEIGTYKGVTTWTIARNAAQGAAVHTLDLPYDERAALDLSELDEANRRAAPERLFELEDPGTKVVQHWGDSATFDFTPFEGSCDLIYVDGAHTQAYVESDTRNAFRMLSRKGAIVWDDYWRQEPGVRDVVDGLGLERTFRVPRTRLVVHLAPAALPTDVDQIGNGSS